MVTDNSDSWLSFANIISILSFLIFRSTIFLSIFERTVSLRGDENRKNEIQMKYISGRGGSFYYLILLLRFGVVRIDQILDLCVPILKIGPHVIPFQFGAHKYDKDKYSILFSILISYLYCK